MKSRVKVFFVVVGLISAGVVGSGFGSQLVGTTQSAISRIKKIVQVFQIVERYYVEEPDEDKMVKGAISGMLETLDPHSVYIPKKSLNKMTEQFEGYFYGIGIEYVVQNKVITVVSPIVGGPAERLGIRPGDQIIKINGESAYGLTEDEVMSKLRGPKGTRVRVTIRRPGVREPFEVVIVRDKIPIYSVTAAFMLDDSTGYVYLGRFARTTAEELESALNKLEGQGATRMVLDLRLNSGGYLDEAVAVADKFLPGGKRIVYTRGRIPSANEDFYSTDETTHPMYPLIVLVDHGSASASEIVAGALQDWDRALIVGERTFGKGLVQAQFRLQDGSAIRVTTARYYTPSGRLIQRSYDKGFYEYYREAYDDSLAAIPDTSGGVFLTAGGRKVYGGGGISPDVYIPSGKMSRFTGDLVRKRLFFEFGSRWAAEHKDFAANFERFRRTFHVKADLLNEFRRFVEKEGMKVPEKAWQKDQRLIANFIKAEIARHLWNSEKYYIVRTEADSQLQKALIHFPEARSLASAHYGLGSGN